jgi:hypothetical protein
VDSTRIIYAPRLGATPEGEVAELASAYRFLLDCHAKKKGGPAITSDNGTKSIEDSANAVRK